MNGVMIYSLIRMQQDDYGTFGELYDPAGKLLCYTCELPWLDNHPQTSCIPQGIYDVAPYQSPKHGKVWQVQDVPDRDYIEIHPSNWPSELKGCIGVGDSIAVIEGKKGVTNSQDTFAMLQAKLPDSFILGIHDVEE